MNISGIFGTKVTYKSTPLNENVKNLPVRKLYRGKTRIFEKIKS